MKTRNGFVSNSSSSSFVVAFPKKPKSEKDVLKFMFDGKEGGVGLEYYGDGLSYRQVAERVFNDINHNNVSKGVLKNIIDEFKYRYHYYAEGHCTIIFGTNVDEFNGRWSCELGRYCGNNKKLMEQLRKHIVASEQNDKELREEEKEILAKFNLKEPQYAYKGGTDPYTKKPFTEEQVRAHDKYYNALNKFKETNSEYIAWQAKQRKEWDAAREKEEMLRDKIAKEDAQNFLDDNKGKFIFIVSYGDEDGQAIMEHGKVFRNVPHVQVNHH